MSEGNRFRIVIPGEFVEDMKEREIGRGIYVQNGKAYAEVLGVVRFGEYDVSVIPFNGKYIPEFGDKVIGVVQEVDISGWRIDINAPYIGYLPISEAVEEYVDQKADLTKFFRKGDIIFCKISRVTKSKSTQCSMRDILAKKLEGGTIIKVNPNKISRIIGKSGSMINLIKDKTGTDIFTGQNGCVWIRGNGEEMAIKAIKMINEDSNSPGLTDKVEKLLGKEEM